MRRTVRIVGALARQSFNHRDFVKWTRPSGHRIGARQDGQDNFSPPAGVSLPVFARKQKMTLSDDTANNVQEEHYHHHLQEHHQLQVNIDMYRASSKNKRKMEAFWTQGKCKRLSVHRDQNEHGSLGKCSRERVYVKQWPFCLV